MPFLTCPWCRKDTFKSQGRLHRHQKKGCQLKPTEIVDDPGPVAHQPTAVTAASDSAMLEDDDGLENDGSDFALAGAGSGAGASRYHWLLHQFKPETDEEFMQQATLFPLENDNEDDDKEASDSEGVENEADRQNQQQEVQQLLDQAELQSPTTHGRSESYCQRIQQAGTSGQQLAFDAEVATDAGDEATTGAQEATSNDPPEEEQADNTNDPAPMEDSSSQQAIVHQPDANDMVQEVGEEQAHDSDTLQVVEEPQQNEGDALPGMEEQTPNNPNDNNSSASSGPDTSICDQFREYCDEMRHHTPSMSAKMKSCIKLMDVLKQKKAPLDTYNNILLWHLHETNIYGHMNLLMMLLVTF